MWDLIIACAEPWGSSGGMLRLIKTPAHQHPSNGGEPQREWTKGKRSPRALPAEGPISIRRELILTGHSHSNRSSQGEEELMWLPYWLLLLLSFRSLPTWRSGLGVSIDQIGLWLTCVLLHAASRHKLVEATGFVKKKKKKELIESEEKMWHLIFFCCGSIYPSLEWLYKSGRGWIRI